MQDLHYWCENLPTNTITSWAEIKKLLQHGADVNKQNTSGRTPLMILCWVYQEEDIKSCIQVFVDHNADVRLTDKFGWNALHFICRFHHSAGLVPAINLLLEHGIDVKAETKSQNCALHQLCQFNSGSQLKLAVQVLVQNDVDSSAKLGRALDLLCRYNHQCEDFETVFHFLIDHGATLTYNAPNRKTLLHSICRYTVGVKMSELIERVMTAIEGSDQISTSEFADKRDIFGNTAMLYAAQAGCVKTVKFLSNFGSLDAVDGFNKNTSSYLLDIVRYESFPLCSCCRNEDIDINSNIFHELSLKPKVRYEFKKIPLSKLVEKIPESMDQGFTNNPKRTRLYIPDPNYWKNLLRQWHSDSELDFSLARNFLNIYGHTKHHDDDPCSWCTISKMVEDYVQSLMDKAAEMDPRFNGELLHYGSSAEGTKILSPDEFDFMLILKHFNEKNHIYQNNYVITSDYNSGDFADKDGNVSSARLLYFYYQLLNNAVHRVSNFHLIYQDISYGETCVTLHLLYRDKPTPLRISVDITVGIARLSTDHLPAFVGNCWPDVPHKEYLVPFRNVSKTELCRWKPSFPSMERDIMRNLDHTVLQCYSLLKLFVMLSQSSQMITSRKTKPSTYALKTCLFEYLKEHSTPWKEVDLPEHILGVCSTFLKQAHICSRLFCFFNPKMPVYEIGEKCLKVIESVQKRVSTITSDSNPIHQPTGIADRPLPPEPKTSCCCCVLCKVM